MVGAGGILLGLAGLCVGAGASEGAINPLLYVASRGGLAEVSGDGSVTVLSSTEYRDVQVRGSSIYASTGDRIDCFNPTGNLIDSFETPYHIGFAALDNGGFALGDNRSDEIHFVDQSGAILHTTKIKPAPDYQGQNFDAFQLGDRLIYAEDGDEHVMSVDLNTYSNSLFKDFSTVVDTALLAITYSDGLFYVCADGDEIYSFTEASDPVMVAELPVSNLTGIVVAGQTAYVTVNFANSLYRVDLPSGAFEVVTSGLDYPRDVEFAIPEPTTLALLAMGGLFIRNRRRGT